MNPTLDLDTLTLAKGSHQDTQDAMCVMEAVAYIAGDLLDRMIALGDAA